MRTMTFFLKTILTLCLFCFVVSVNADTTTDSLHTALKDLQQKFTELQVQVGALQAQTADRKITVSEGDDVLAGRNGAVYLPKRESSSTPMEIAAPMTPVAALDNKLQLSGYMDAVYTAHEAGVQKNEAALHQVELDLLREFNPRANVGLSLYYENEFSVYCATFNYLLYKAPETTLWDPPVINWTVTAGKFDIPFGLDYQSNSAITRETVTMPKVVENTHGGWNDIGLLNQWDTRWGTVSAYAVKGFSSRVWTSPDMSALDAADDDASWHAIDPSVSGGVRYNATPFANLNLGFSAANSWSKQKSDRMNVIGVHAQSTLGFWSGMAEALQCQRETDGFKNTTRGYYVQSKESYKRAYLIQRFDFVDDTLLPTERYLSAGLGFDAGAGFWLRGEYQWNKTPDQRTVMLQVAASF